MPLIGQINISFALHQSAGSFHEGGALILKDGTGMSGGQNHLSGLSRCSLDSQLQYHLVLETPLRTPL